MKFGNLFPNDSSNTAILVQPAGLNLSLSLVLLHIVELLIRSHVEYSFSYVGFLRQPTECVLQNPWSAVSLVFPHNVMLVSASLFLH